MDVLGRRGGAAARAPLASVLELVKAETPALHGDSRRIGTRVFPAHPQRLPTRGSSGQIGQPAVAAGIDTQLESGVNAGAGLQPLQVPEERPPRYPQRPDDVLVIHPRR
ncbi:MAG: hypothetical protein JWN95_329 [Frankiales bacterium]|nr:hypothetical protein [Frankiales bacterium]